MLQSDKVAKVSASLAFTHLVPLYFKTWPDEADVIITSVVRPDSDVVPENVIVLFVSLNVAPDNV